MSLPWFPFFVDDFLASSKVRRMSAAQIGSYLLLMCEQWQEGAVDASDMDELASVAKSSPETVRKLLETCFEEEGGVWVNRRLQSVKAEQEARSDQAKAAAKARWRKGKNAGASDEHMRTQSVRNAIHSHTQNHTPPDGGESRAREAAGREPGPAFDADDPWASLDPLTLAGIRGMFGGPDREGTDATIWRGANGMDRERARTLALTRWLSEGHERFNARLFRRILETVIAEQSTHDEPGGEPLWP